MTEKRFYCIDEDEYNSYWIADTSKVDKNKEDFYDEKEELYQIYEFEEYLEDNNAVLKGEEVVDLLNKQHEDILFNIKLIDSLQDAIGELKEENEQLKQVINENEKLIQFTYDELTKLRCIKKNLRRIKTQWNWMMEAIEYD